MNDKCCRLQYLLTPDKIKKIFTIYGKNLELWDNKFEDDLPHGFLMQKPEEGYPCDHLTPDGCSFEPESKKPLKCQNFPTCKADLHLIDNCGFRFDEKGVHRGECNRCTDV